MIRTRESWWGFTMDRGTDGSQVHLILADWKEERAELAKTLTDIHTTVKAGLPGKIVEGMLLRLIAGLTDTDETDE